MPSNIELWEKIENKLSAAIADTGLRNATDFSTYFKALAKQNNFVFSEDENCLKCLIEAVDESVDRLRKNKLRYPGELSEHCCALLCIFSEHDVQLPALNVLQGIWNALTNNEMGRHTFFQKKEQKKEKAARDSVNNLLGLAVNSNKWDDKKWDDVSNMIDQWDAEDPDGTFKSIRKFLCCYIQQKKHQHQQETLSLTVVPNRMQTNLFNEKKGEEAQPAALPTEVPQLAQDTENASLTEGSGTASHCHCCLLQ